MKKRIQFILQNNAFALLEVLIAIAIFSMITVSIYSVVSNGTLYITNSSKYLKACIIAKSKLNEFRLEKSKLDLSNVKVEEDDRFTYSRKLERYENPLLGPLQAQKVTIEVNWNDNNNSRSYSLSYIFPEN